MATFEQKIAAFQELERRGELESLPPNIVGAYRELQRRGEIPGAEVTEQQQEAAIIEPPAAPRSAYEAAAMQGQPTAPIQTAMPENAFEAFGQSFGNALQDTGYSLARLGLGAADMVIPGRIAKRDELAQQQALLQQRQQEISELFPKSAFAGGLGGEAVGLLAPGGLGAKAATKAATTLAPRLLAGTVGRGAVAGTGAGLAEGIVTGTGKDDVAGESMLGALFGGAIGAAIPGGASIVRKLRKGEQGAAEEAAKEIKSFATERFKSQYGRDPSQDEINQIEQFIKSRDQDDLARLLVPDELTDQQIARQQLFEGQDIETTRARITQLGQDVERELKLSRNVAAGDAAEQLREARIRESKDIRQALGRNVSDLELTPDTEQTGEVLKTALSDIQSGMKAKSGAAYRKLAEMMGGAEKVPLPTGGENGLKNAVNEALFGERPISPENRNAVLKAAARFGIVGDVDQAVKQGDVFKVPFEGKDITITKPPQQLNISNFEDFRKALNKAAQGDMSGAVKPVIRSLDDTLEQATRQLEGTAEGKILNQAKKARKTFQKERKLFDNKDLLQNLIDFKKGSDTPKIYSSQAVKEIFKPGRSTEEVRKLVKTLDKGGNKSRKALTMLQDNTVNDLIDSSFSTPSNKMDGEMLFNHTQFIRNFDKQKSKIQEIFKGQPEKLKNLEDIRQIAEIMTKDIGSAGSDTQRNLAAALSGSLLKASGMFAKFPLAGEILSALAGKGDQVIKDQQAIRMIAAPTEVQTAKNIKAARAQIKGAFDGYPRLQKQADLFLNRIARQLGQEARREAVQAEQ